jgi:hypothetical protein
MHARCIGPRRRAAFASTRPQSRVRREYSRTAVLLAAAVEYSRERWQCLRTDSMQPATTGVRCIIRRRARHAPAAHHGMQRLGWRGQVYVSPDAQEVANTGGHGIGCVFAHCMLCRPYACCSVGGSLLVAFYNSWQSDPPTRSADVEAHRSNLDADAPPTCAADRRRVADDTQHTTCGVHHACGMHHGAQQPAACAQALSSTLRGRLETTTPMVERASLERAEPVSEAPSARPEYLEYPHVSTQSSQLRAPDSKVSDFPARVRRHPA